MRPTHSADVTVPPPRTRVGGALVDIQDLIWRPFGRRTPILDGLTLRIEPGTRVLLAGPSGCGKSTLLRAIAGVLTTTESGELAGSVTVDGAGFGGVVSQSSDLNGPHSRGEGANVGLLVQDPADAAVAGRVGRDVAFGLENIGVGRADIWQRVRRTLDAVGFPYGPHHPVEALSGGQAQCLALAGVLVLEPGLVLLDEPSAMLDPVAAAAVREAIWGAVGASGATVILVEHELDAWLPQIDRVIVLRPDGAIGRDGTVAETLLADAEALADQGVWVPAARAPRPLAVPAELCAPVGAPTPTGGAVMSARGVGVLRTTREGLGGREPTSAIRTLWGVDAEARAGEILAVVGPSGAGKSTLTALLAGLEAPFSGAVVAGECVRAGLGEDPSTWGSTQLARRVGWVPQQAELAVVGRTVRDDVLSTSRRLGIEQPEPRVDALLEVLGLTASAGVDPHHLSGGQMRRLALAGAVAHGPSLLVLDEPTVGQDRQTWAAVAGVIVAARDAGTAVVVATHDPLLIALADRCIRLEQGRIVGGTRADGRDLSNEPMPWEDRSSSAGPLRSTTATPRAAFRPLAARAGPLALLGASALLLAGGLTVSTLPQGLIGVAAELLLAPLVIGWRGHGIRRVLPGLLAVASVGFSTWLLSEGQSPVIAAIAALRIAFFVLPGVLLVRFIDPFALGDHLAQRLRLPGRPVVAAVAALQRFESLAEQWEQLRRTRRVRGLAAGRSPVAKARGLVTLTFALLVQSLRQAGRMAVGMEARGFSSALALGVRRTWAEGAPWLLADTVLLALAAGVAAIPLVLAITR
ncbi:ATP-binding cassette domain-containing protein [Demequina lutea]|uniref:Energy-coupling factor transport system ATP-binding protein n=1 Tax=Demequina lutea TaxID=431489 RepID=A0A7Z0CIR7_9MICO|nr:ATP-binding cassette domain-containing protein [Demequina lutea]NYI42224.1 energy-coupling factor transport system ATP-binding protein [Demequina lutea]